jgi:DNA topoisomerase-1
MEESLDLVEDGDLDWVKLLSEFYAPFAIELEHAGQNIEKTKVFVKETCPLCGRLLEIKWGRRGQFLSCSGFPECKHAQPITTGVACPQSGCDGQLVKRRSKTGRSFYGCTKYPACTYTSNSLPEEQAKE